ncbi:hypothetical protein HK44_020695 [Pseudomonas fluorescens HK44]|uniref:Uncharacterized protein n=1 Tax=Pseudomonas fluorescens HK44 TaxID=1042209 RepID=A0A010SU68_PSEFL|nr:hypothetical protein [Pseudomonas fluorescens]EXF96290.1 hypothetical protein HK44_020695 [Pseudomonas fluorescens HK44]
MKAPLKFRVQEWLASRTKRAQYPKQKFIPKNQVAQKELDWLDKIGRLMIFAVAMWWIFGPVIIVVGFFAIAALQPE